MLERLDDIAWKELRHAYGSAEDVPGQIRNLLSPEQKVRKNARWKLYGNIFHQGSRYEATPYAVPFLYELIQSRDTPERPELILMLVHLALGYEEEYLPDGINISQYRQELKDAHEKLDDEQREGNLKYGHSLQALIEVYDEVRKGLPVLYELLNDSDVEIVKVATYVLAWFPEEARKTIPEISARIPAMEEEALLANALLSLGLLEKASAESSGIDFFTYLQADSPMIRAAAAICLAGEPLSKEILEVLINSLLHKKELEGCDSCYFNDGDLVGYISRVLASYGAKEKEQVLPVLCETLAKVNAYESLDITEAILLIFNGKSDTAYWKRFSGSIKQAGKNVPGKHPQVRRLDLGKRSVCQLFSLASVCRLASHTGRVKKFFIGRKT